MNNFKAPTAKPGAVFTRDGLNGRLTARDVNDPRVAGWENSHVVEVDEKTGMKKVVFVSEQEAADAAANASMEQFHAENPVD